MDANFNKLKRNFRQDPEQFLNLKILQRRLGSLLQYLIYPLTSEYKNTVTMKKWGYASSRTRTNFHILSGTSTMLNPRISRFHRTLSNVNSSRMSCLTRTRTTSVQISYTYSEAGSNRSLRLSI